MNTAGPLLSQPQQDFVPNAHDDIVRILTTELKVGVLVQLPDSEIIFSNARALELLGLSLDQLLGKTSLDPDWNVIHRDGTDFPGSTHPVPVATQTRQAVHNVEMGVYRPATGSRVWLLVNADPTLNDDGTVRHVVCTFSDVCSENPAHIDSRPTALGLNKAVLDAVDAEIAVLSHDGVIVAVNEAWRRFSLENCLATGEIPPYTDVGTNYLAVCKRSAAQSDTGAADTWRGIEAVVHGAVPRFSMEYPCHSASVQRWFSMSVTPLGPKAADGIVVVHTNITERKLAELSLQTAQKELEQAQHIAQVGSWHWDPVADEVVASAELLRIYGVDAMPSWQAQRGTLFSIDTWEQLNSAVEQSIQTRAGYDLELPMLRPDGVNIWIQAFGHPVFSASGTLIAFRGTVQDITEKRRVAMRLKDNEERLRHAIAATSDGIWDWDVITGKVYRSPRYYELFGKLPEDDFGGFEFVKTVIHPEDLATALEIIDRHLHDASSPLEFDFRPSQPDSKHCWLSAKGRAVERDAQGKATRVVGVVSDITTRKAAEIALQEREQLLDRVLKGSNLGYWDLSLQAMTLQVSASLEAMLGYERGQMNVSLDHWQDHIHSDDLTEVMRSIQQQLAGEQPSMTMDIRFKNKTGAWRWMQARGGVVSWSEVGRPLKLSGTLTDITDQRSFEVAQRDAATVFSSSFEGIMVVDKDLMVLRVNPAFNRITGYAPDEAIGRPSSLLSSGRHDAAFYETLWRAVDEQGFWNGEVWDRRKNGDLYAALLSISAVRDTAGVFQHYVGVFSDISKFKVHEEELDRIAHYDPLTGSPNRRLLEDRLGQAIRRADRNGRSLAVFYLDLDSFKAVNDIHGHAVGDKILVEMARRLKMVLRSDDTMARLGGDEFILLLSDIADAPECTQILDRFMSAIGEPIMHGDASIFLTASAGVSLYPDDQGDVDSLMRHADLAMLAAKESGKNRYHFFDSENDRKAKQQHAYLLNLKVAFKKQEFVLYYQPKVNLISGRVIGAEALIRWNSLADGLISPAEFLPHVYGTELEIPLGEWVIQSAVQQAALWQQAGLDMTVSVNVSAHQLLKPDFVETLVRALGHFPSFPSSHLELEILETAAIADIDQAVLVINKCRAIGVQFALDDFGTGYSSLTYLRKLPVQTLKIDQSFVRNMLRSEDDMGIVESVIRLGGTFGRQIIAEGVETMAHGSELLRMGCPLAQGFGIARPMPGEQLIPWMHEWNSASAWTGLQTGDFVI